MTFLAIAILSINLCGFLFGLIFLSRRNWREHFWKLPVFLQKLFPFVIVGPVFIAPLIPQNRFNIDTFISLPTGILLFVLGCILGISALFKFGTIPSIRKKSNLITTGAYRVVRHPVYSGTLISALGWTILLKSIISLVYFPFLFLLYFFVTFIEERTLIEQYGDQYLDYKEKVTKRFIPFIV
ncbi:MAG: methyltransferase family protein [Planctomycetota bacterium]|jgi:protein-S-isoprenylcysteine O-methyltransferase Ste14